MGEAKEKLTQPRKSLVARTLNLLASVKFAVAVVIVIAVACVVGTILPQGADAVKYTQKFPAAAARMQLFGRLGLTHVFASGWFVLLLGVLAASVATCSVRRFATIRRTSGYARRRALGSMLTHISILLILGGGVIRGIWGEKGHLEFREGQTVAQFVDHRGARPLPFALHLADFELETDAVPAAAVAAASTHDQCNEILVHWPAKQLTAKLPIKLGEEQTVGEGEQAFRIKILQYIPDFLINTETREVTSRSNEPRNPAILVAVAGPAYSNHRWLFAKFPEFTMPTPDSEATGPSPLQLTYVNHGTATPPRAVNAPIKNFRSALQVIEGNTVTHEQSIAVNSPMRYKGYTFYQSGYNPRDLSYTSLQVVKDPGVPVVYAGFAFMIGGLFLVFYLNPWLEGRKKP